MVSRKLRFAIFGNTYQPKKSVSVQKLLACLTQRQADVCIEREFYEFLTAGQRLPIDNVLVIEDRDFKADFVISMGGDGTFLRAASMVGGKQIPILGINTGRLGFLADFSPEDIPYAIDQIYAKGLRTEERSVLHLSYSEGEPTDYPFALNEVAVLKRDNSSMISIRVDIDGEYLTTYQADGLIINTPTGSTGYALSVGGPVIHPDSKTIGLVPVAPHSLNVRPFTLSDDKVITLTVESRNHNFLVAVDGRSEKCQEGVKLSIRRAPYLIKVLKRSNGSFFHTLRDKMMWGSDVRI